MADPFPLFGVFPALRLARGLELGDWCIGTPDAAVPWRSDRFKDLSLKLVESFRRSGFKDECPLLWHRSRGFDGTAPASRDLGALIFAVGFAVLDANDQVSRDDNAAMYLATVENADLFLQPIDEARGRITHRRGGELRSVVLVGPKIGGDPPPLSDAVLPLRRALRVSRNVAKAVFDLLKTGGQSADRVQIALEWHSAAMANSHSVTKQQRVIALKTALEVLTGTSDSREAARRIRTLFESVTAQHGGLLPWTGVLWAPNERTNLQRPYVTKGGKVKQDVRSELEDCVMALADVRNVVIHQGRLPSLNWSGPPERPLSRYAGDLFWKGERIVREAIKATLGAEVLLCGPIARRAQWQKVADEVNQARPLSTAVDSPSPPAVVETPALTLSVPVELPARDLRTLLSELRADAANKVTIETLGGFGSASEEAAIEMANNAAGQWGATAGSVTMMITDAERVILEQAGAEQEVPDYWAPCD